MQAQAAEAYGHARCSAKLLLRDGKSLRIICVEPAVMFQRIPFLEQSIPDSLNGEGSFPRRFLQPDASAKS
jgi:hypothetical protein